MSRERILRFDNPPSFPAKLSSQVGIAQQHSDAAGQFLCVLGFKEKTGFTVPD
jgi:hypothetical protein